MGDIMNIDERIEKYLNEGSKPIKSITDLF